MKKTILVSFMVLISMLVVACGKNNESGKKNPPGVNPPVLNPAFPGVTPVGNADSLTNELIERINQRRVTVGMRPVARDATLDIYAQNKAADLSDRRAPNTRTCRILPDSIRGVHCGETSIKGSLIPALVVGEMLRGEEEDRLRILREPRHSRVGVGISQDRNGNPIWVVLMTSN